MRSELHFWDLPKKSMILLEDNKFKYIANVTQEMEKDIKEIKSSYNGKSISISFPIDFLTEEWASLIGAILSEGNINKNNLEVGFWNKNKQLFEEYIKLINSLIRSDIRIDKNVYGCFLPKIFGEILISGLGASKGNKVYNDIGIPKIFMDSNDEKIVSALLRWLFSGDGWLSIFKDHLGQTHRVIGIGFGSFKKGRTPKLLIDTMKLLDKLDIKYNGPYQEIKITKRREVTYYWKIFIKGKNNIINFREKINFVTRDKQLKIDKIISSYKKPKLCDGESLLMVMNSIKRLNELGLDTNKHNIYELTKLNSKWVERILKNAVRKKLLIVIDGGSKCKGIWGCRYPYLYGITDKGLKFINVVII